MSPADQQLRDRARLDRLGRHAQRWAWAARSGDPSAVAVARTLQALHLAALGRDLDLLKRLGRQSARYLEGAIGLSLAPQDAAHTYERIVGAIERAIAGVADEVEKQRRAAQLFVVVGRACSFLLPRIADLDDDAAVEFCQRALARYPRRLLRDDEERSEAWTRALAKACGRSDGANATKHRWRSSTRVASGTSLGADARRRSGRTP